MTANRFSPNRILLINAVAAVLPFLFQLSDIKSNCIYMGITLCAYWMTAALFWMIRPFFPEKGSGVALMAWLTVLAAYVWRHSAAPPFWILSVIFLQDEDGAKEPREAGFEWGEIVRKSTGFAVLMIGISLAQGLLTGKTGGGIARHPAGVLFLLAIILTLWQSRPAQTRRAAA
ncbi:MAG: hypothetical protein A2Z83_02425 [Omnitrophica bacterium GWA2_52_8]|nr:MAG: hypothetical protein A2Z83_02425 [Omnitrophica bacterium GWA2_52_8]